MTKYKVIIKETCITEKEVHVDAKNYEDAKYKAFDSLKYKTVNEHKDRRIKDANPFV